MTVWGYARVSTVDQDVTGQLEALRRAGVTDERIVCDHTSGTKADRPGLTRLMSELQSGDVLTVWKLDRLGRSMSHLVATVELLAGRGVEFRSLTEALDTTSSAGRLLFHIIAAVAQFEREITVERTKLALAAARSAGTLGRPSRVSERQYRLIHQMAEVGETQAAIASTTGLTRAVVGRVLRGEIASLAKYQPVSPAMQKGQPDD